MLRGNKGEWSEIYALFSILSEGELVAADADLNAFADGASLKVLRVLRKEKNQPQVSFYVGDSIEVVADDGEPIASVEREKMAQEARTLYYGIVDLPHESATFELPETEEFMHSIGVHALKAPSNDKSDIILQVHDSHSGIDPVCGWSIKSELGNPPTLLNAGRTTNFTFEIIGCTDELMDSINSIDTRFKVRDRLAELETRCQLKFSETANDVFDRNMRLIDSLFPQLMGHALLEYYVGRGPSCRQIVDNLEAMDPLCLGAGMYEFKFKKFLCSVALGMMPATPWNGREDATGGYIVVREDGKVLAFHIYNRDSFEDYLLESTRFDTASMTRHDFGYVYKSEGRYFIDLNLQVRFR